MYSVPTAHAMLLDVLHCFPTVFRSLFDAYVLRGDVMFCVGYRYFPYL